MKVLWGLLFVNNQNTAKSIDSYLNQLQKINSHLPFNHIDIIIDQSGLEESLVPLLSKLDDNLVWASLFESFPEEGLLEQAPLLVRIQWNEQIHRLLLNEILEYLYGKPRTLFIYSELHFDELFKRLQSQLEITWGKQNCLLRFYDPRIFPELMSHILTLEQRQAFNEIAYMWGWLNRDQKISWLPGLFKPNAAISQSSMIELDDRQFDMLDGISDVTRLMSMKKFHRPELTQEQNFSVLYQLTLQFIDSDYLGDLNSYILQQQSTTSFIE